jgi:hypothetical protein
MAADRLLLLGDKDRPHATCTDLFHQLVWPDRRAGALANQIIEGGPKSSGRLFQETPLSARFSITF